MYFAVLHFHTKGVLQGPFSAEQILTNTIYFPFTWLHVFSYSGHPTLQISLYVLLYMYYLFIFWKLFFTSARPHKFWFGSHVHP